MTDPLTTAEGAREAELVMAKSRMVTMPFPRSREEGEQMARRLVMVEIALGDLADYYAEHPEMEVHDA